MKVKNISARVHHVGNVVVIPGEEKEIPKEYADSINRNELVPIASVVKEESQEEPVKRGRKPSADKE